MTYFEGLGADRDAPPEREPVALGAIDAPERRRRERPEDLARLVRPRTALEAVELRSESQALGGLLRIRGAREERARERQRDSAAKQPRFAVTLDRRVDEERALVVHAIGAVRAEDGPLDAHGRVRVDVTLHVVRDPTRKLAASRHFAGIHRDGSHMSPATQSSPNAACMAAAAGEGERNDREDQKLGIRTEARRAPLGRVLCDRDLARNLLVVSCPL